MSTNIEETNFDRNFFHSAVTYFKLTGLWRTDKQSKWLIIYLYICRFNMYIVFGWAFTAAVVSGCYLYFKDGEIDRALDWGTFAFAYATMQYKFVILGMNERKIRNIIRRLEIYSSRYPNKTNVRKSLQASERLAVIGSVMIAISCIVYCMYPVVINYKKVLPIKTMFTFGWNVLQSPIYECYIAYQILGTICHAVSAMVFDMTYVGFLLTSAAILRNLNTEMKINVIEKDLSFKNKHKELVKYIKEHIDIFEFLNEIRELFIGSNMVHFSYNYMTAGLTLFQASKQPVGSMRFYAMVAGCSSVVFGLVTYCESSQKVCDEMHQFWQNLYCTDWYRQPHKFRKTIAQALHGTQMDYYMIAGKMMTLSRETEKRIMQAIFTYYTCLLRLNS